jgi:hypothetical protein
MSAHLIAATVPVWLVWVGRSLRESASMFLETLWPLGLGFALSGAIQAFATRDQMEHRLGNHHPAAVLRASGYGMASSSCSYAAAAMAKSLFQRGADFVTSMVFMFASTNLVIELGVVLAVLVGWRFLAAEFVGGAVMIVLLALAGAFVLTPKLTDAARRQLGGADDRVAAGGKSALADRLRNSARWREAASYAIADLKMLRFELVAGYLAAGALAAVVPASFWTALFIPGHGLWTSLENALIGPLIALISCVCSVGNVPLAAALWNGGIAFGGVVAFLFADLLSLPLVFVYRRYYGRLAWRLVPLFWVVMSAAGLVTEGLFSLAGLLPSAHRGQLARPTFSFGWSDALDLLALAALAGLFLVHRRRNEDDGSRLATDPVCGMQVEKANPGASLVVNGTTHYFCSDGCRDHYAATQMVET